MKNPLLELQDINFSYHTAKGETKALKNISLRVDPGEFLAIVGPSGCGKSTLLSLIAGLLSPESGRISFLETAISAETAPIGYMLQHDHLLEWRTVYKNVILGLEINHMLTPDRLEYVNKLLDSYGLSQFRDKHPRELSGGMKQRAALIRTLALNPKLLLLDEPFSALDYQTRLSVSADICRLIRETNKATILVTHDLSEAISLADRVLVLSGRPATVKYELPIHLTCTDPSPLASRNAPEFHQYFNQLWEELQSDPEEI